MNLWAILMLVGGGLFSGGVLVFAWDRVPAWRDLPLAQFKSDFARGIHKADRVQPALLVMTIVATLGFGITATGPARALALIGAAGFIVILIGSGAILVPLQRRIVASSQQHSVALEAMRLRWFRGHLSRALVGVVSFLVVAMSAAV